MKKVLLILLYLPFIGFGQITYVPDDAFENYLRNKILTTLSYQCRRHKRSKRECQ